MLSSPSDIGPRHDVCSTWRMCLEQRMRKKPTKMLAKSRQAHHVPCMTITIAWQSASPHSIVAVYEEWHGTRKGVQSRAFIQQRTGAEHGSVRAPAMEH